MPRAKRCEQFDAGEVCIVHVVQRCVRRAFLAGVDRDSGRDFSYRKGWIRRRMEALASVFAVDILSYAIMSNHMHQILRNRPDLVADWTDQQCAIRWLKVFPGRRLEEHLADPTEADVQALCSDAERIAEIRLRLSDISWFMRALAEPIARMANQEDDCTGRFWEGRFKAQRIADEAGLLACSMYVDLNPVRAAVAETPDESNHTSAYDRIHASQGKQIASAAYDLVPVSTEQAGEAIRSTPVAELKEKRKAKKRNPTGKCVRQDGWLSPLTLKHDHTAQDVEPHAEGFRASDKGFLTVTLRDYLRLLRWTASQVRGVARTNVPPSLARLLTHLGIDASMWRDLVVNWQNYFGKSACIGHPRSVRQDCESLAKNWHRTQRGVATCFV